MWASFEVIKGDAVGGDHACPCPGFNTHIADGHTAFHREFLYDGATVFNNVPLPTRGTNLRNNGENNVLGGNSWLHFTSDSDGHGLKRLERQCLSGHDVLYLRGANTEG